MFSNFRHRLTFLCRKKGGYKVEIERELANLALFLCTKAGIGVEGAVIGTNGSCESFE
jgi:hypothetical protein